MCWVGKCDVKIAKRDFYVYKLGCISDEGFHSLYQNFIYVPGVINKKVKMTSEQQKAQEEFFRLLNGGDKDE